MKIIVSLPKELSKLVSNRYYTQHHGVSTRSDSTPAAQYSPLLQKPTYAVGQANEENW